MPEHQRHHSELPICGDVRSVSTDCVCLCTRFTRARMSESDADGLLWFGSTFKRLLLHCNTKQSDRALVDIHPGVAVKVLDRPCFCLPLTR